MIDVRLPGRAAGKLEPALAGEWEAGGGWQRPPPGGRGVRAAHVERAAISRERYRSARSWNRGGRPQLPREEGRTARREGRQGRLQRWIAGQT